MWLSMEVLLGASLEADLPEALEKVLSSEKD